MMVAEIVGGLLFGSIALVADGLHMSHPCRRPAAGRAGLQLRAPPRRRSALHLRHRQARRPRRLHQRHHPGDDRPADRLRGGQPPVRTRCRSISARRSRSPCLGLARERRQRLAARRRRPSSPWPWPRARSWHEHDHDDEAHRIETGAGHVVARDLRGRRPAALPAARRDGSAPGAAGRRRSRPSGRTARARSFAMVERGGYLEFGRGDPGAARLHRPRADRRATTTPSSSRSTSTRTARRDRDNNMRAAIVHVMADAAVSVLVIVGLLLARAFGWLWMDPLAGIVGACVIASWSYGLIRRHRRDPARHEPRSAAGRQVRQAIEATATGWPTFTCGGWARATWAPSSPWSPRSSRSRLLSRASRGRSSPCPISRSRSRLHRRDGFLARIVAVSAHGRRRKSSRPRRCARTRARPIFIVRSSRRNRLTFPR